MKIKPGTILGEAFPAKHDCSYLSFAGDDLGHIYKVVDSLKAKGRTTTLCNHHLQIIYNHCENANKYDPWIISLERTLITSYDVCIPSEYVIRDS